jgi:hypothetical protein
MLWFPLHVPEKIGTEEDEFLFVKYFYLYTTASGRSQSENHKIFRHGRVTGTTTFFSSALFTVSS